MMIDENFIPRNGATDRTGCTGTVSMKRKRKRPILLKVLLVVAALIGLQCLWLLLSPHVRAWQVERAIGRFEAAPSQARAEILVDALQTHSATAEQGGRILGLLCYPRLVMRESYPVGRPVAVALEPTFEVGFHQTVWELVNVSITDGSTIRPDHFPDGPLLVQTDAGYPQPGTYPLEIRCRFGVGLERGRRPSEVGHYLRGLLSRVVSLGRIGAPGAWKPARTYECDRTMRAEAVIVEQNEADVIKQLCDAQLDTKMRAAITWWPLFDRSVTEGSRLSYFHIQYRDIPVAMSFACFLRLPDGREITYQGWHPDRFRARAGSSGSIHVHIQDFRFHESGRYAAEIVLKPDPELAWQDTAIAEIWGGTLEYPFTLQIGQNRGER
jgi:hypothetical protein